MKKIFFRSLLFSIAVNVIVKPLYIFFIDREVQNQVGHESYGTYFSLFNLSFVFSMLIDMGITNYSNRSVSEKPELAKEFFSSIMLLKVFLFMIYLTLTMLAGVILQHSVYELQLLFFMCISQALLSFILYLRSNVSSFHYFKTDSVLSSLDKIFLSAVIGSLLFFASLHQYLTIQNFIVAQVAVYGIVFLIALFINSKLIGKLSHPIEWHRMKSLLKQSLPYAIIVLLMAIYTKSDGIMIEKILGESGKIEAGLYASAYRILDAINQFGFLFAAILIPVFSRLIAEKKNVSSITQSGFLVIIVFSLLAVANIFVYANPIMQLLYHTDSSATILSIIIISLLGTSSVYVFGSLLVANGNLKEYVFISAFGVVLNLSLNYFLIHTMSAKGAAIATTVTQLSIAALQAIVCFTKIKIKFSFNFILRLFSSAILCFGFAWIAQFISIDWKFQLLISIGGSLFSFILFRIFQIRQLLSVFQTERS